MSTKKGWYSGKYDSTKQHQVIYKNNDGMLKYKTSIRFEMLLSDMLVITDAQWYDGTFFAKMVTESENEFDDFMNFILKGLDRDCAPLAIRRRTQYMDMFKKPFLFSSITNPELRNFILNIWNGNEDKKEEKCCNLPTYLSFIKDELTEKISKTDSFIWDDFYNFQTGIRKLDSVDERLFIPWGNKSYIPQEMELAKPKLLKLLTEKSELNSHITSVIQKIRQELEKDYPNRSKIKKKINSIQESTSDTDFAERFMHIFDTHYNLAIAEQHDCKYYDLYDAITIASSDKANQKSIYLDNQKFPNKVIEYLGRITWSEFGNIFYDDRVTEKRKKWLSDFDSQNAEIAQQSFLAYLDCIMKKMEPLKIWLIDNSIFYRAAGTKRFFITGDEVGRMVGGAGSDTMTDSDEICLFFGNDFNNIAKDKIIRYSSTDDTKDLFDTVFAPIESFINSKK